ncbi:restriction endonuclease [Synechococcus sp. ROS8604]|uniref:restriction endonuclease n=1 Tax=Synechococcus sp. ROS8604 TaxID=1442557 RepID=UPI001648834B|nr:restriction endonuclease [Synechococcus sp. ROS8604]QNI87740.1 type IV restriction-modification system/ Mrr cat superfamily [Synechococcus sp. ROS8604]
MSEETGLVEIPKWHQFMLPLLKVLQERGELSRNDAIEAVVQKVGLSEEQMALSQESNGKSIVRGRIGWASSYLRSAGALIGPKRGYFALGPNAQNLFGLNRPIKRADLTGFKEWQDHEASKQAKNHASSDSTADINTEDSTPEDLIEAGVKQIKEQLVSDLLDQMKEMDPHDFEGLVLDVLPAMGYGGGSRQAMQGVPRGPDGGIDGKINEDKLGLDQIYMQAKRYSENSVSSEKVQAFVGAMTSGGCRKGVFVTTSKFTADAIRFANSIRDPRLVLVDGDKLANLMIQHGVGIQTKEVIKISKIDLDFFSGGGD